MGNYLGLHETLEVHELLAFKSLCLTKSSTMSGLVQDVELKTILSNNLGTGRNHILQLQRFLTDRGDEI